MTQNYQKLYKQKSYNKKNKIVTFLLRKSLYEKLSEKSTYYDMSVNAYVKN